MRTFLLAVALMCCTGCGHECNQNTPECTGGPFDLSATPRDLAVPLDLYVTCTMRLMNADNERCFVPCV